MTPRRVLILGHTGLIGSAVRRRLETDFNNVQVAGFSSPELDLAREEHAECLAELLGPDTAVVVCAGVKRQLGDTLDICMANIRMAANLCAVLVRRPPARVVYLSSAAVYGEDVHNTDITEDTPVRPRSFYGVAKLAAEGMLAGTFAALGQEKLLLLRPPLVYGPGETGLFYGPSGFLKSALAGNPVTLWGDGTERREFIFVDDAAAVIAQLALGGGHGVVNLASGRSSTFAEALKCVGRLLGRPPTVVSRPRSKAKVDNVFSGAKLAGLLPDFRFTTLEEGLRLTEASLRAESAS